MRDVVLVDMDGVLADFDAAVLGQLPAVVEPVARAHFYIAEDYPRHAVHVEYLTAPRLIDLGYRPRICSAPLSRNAHSAQTKLAWLRRRFVPHFGEWVVNEAIIDKDKYRYDGIALIDDRPDVDTNNDRATWCHVVFDHPYNQRSGAAFRIRGWDDPLLASILDAARKRTHT